MTDTNVEAAKRAAGQQAVADHFDPSASYVGIGSGTTIVYVVEAIKERSTNPAIRFVPTGYQSRQVIINAGLTPVSFDALLGSKPGLHPTRQDRGRRSTSPGTT